MPRPVGRGSKPVGKEGLEPWKVLKSTEIFSAEPWIKLSVDQVLLPDGRVVDDYHQIKLQEHVVIFAETVGKEVVAIRLYKHGAGKVSLVLPAGGIEDGEEPLACAKRELLEETGYASKEWASLGSFVSHGNYGCGKGHLFRARDAQQIAEPNAGDLETIEVVLMRQGEMLEAVGRGEVAGLGTVAAIALATNPAFKAGEMKKPINP